MIDLLNNNIGRDGCESLGKVFENLSIKCQVKQLLMDHNPIKDIGM
jgi:hypothetical protein